MRDQESDYESTASEEVQKKKSRKLTRKLVLWKRNEVRGARNWQVFVNWKGNLTKKKSESSLCLQITLLESNYRRKSI